MWLLLRCLPLQVELRLWWLRQWLLALLLGLLTRLRLLLSVLLLLLHSNARCHQPVALLLSQLRLKLLPRSRGLSLPPLLLLACPCLPAPLQCLLQVHLELLSQPFAPLGPLPLLLRNHVGRVPFRLALVQLVIQGSIELLLLTCVGVSEGRGWGGVRMQAERQPISSAWTMTGL